MLREEEAEQRPLLRRGPKKDSGSVGRRARSVEAEAGYLLKAEGLSRRLDAVESGCSEGGRSVGLVRRVVVRERGRQAPTSAALLNPHPTEPHGGRSVGRERGLLGHQKRTGAHVRSLTPAPVCGVGYAARHARPRGSFDFSR